MAVTGLNLQTGNPDGMKKGISGSTIKIIAVIAMLIDHTAAVILTRRMVAGGLAEAAAGGQVPFMNWITNHSLLYYGNMVMRGIGRLGFPIFCFLLVEGFQRSRNVRKYAMRLGLFALISEIPFDLALTGSWSYMRYQNVYFTLLLGLLGLCAYGFFGKYEQDGEGRDLPVGVRGFFTVTGILAPAAFVAAAMAIPAGQDGTGLSGTISVTSLLTVLILLLYGWKRSFRRIQTVCADLTVLMALMYAGELLRTDYGGMGVLTITMMYVFRKRRVVCMFAGCVVLTLMSFNEITAFLSLIPIALYNGSRGLKMKYFFYAFYPVHLFLLFLISVLLGLGSVTLVY